MDENTKAYLAGLLDTSSFIYFKKSKNKSGKGYRYRIEGRLMATERPGIISIFHTYYGRGYVRNAYHTIYKHDTLTQILEDIEPYLISNKEKAHLALKFLRTKQLIVYNINNWFHEKYRQFKENLFQSFYNPSYFLINQAYNPFYIAGLFDASGSYGVHCGRYKKKKTNIKLYFQKRFQLNISTNKTEILIYLRNHLGGTINKTNNAIIFTYEQAKNIGKQIGDLLKISASKMYGFQTILCFSQTCETDFLIVYKTNKHFLDHFDEVKKCNKCSQILPMKYFQTKRQPNRCSNCTKEKLKAYYRQNREKLKIYSKIYSEKHGKKKDTKSKIVSNIRKRVRHVMKGQGLKRCEMYFGCTPEFLKNWLESQFTPEMSWDNYGILWHIDHKKPVAAFNLELEEDRKQVNHYTNLQPLTAIDNAKKGSQYL